MAVATLEELKAQLNITPDLGDADDALLGRLLLVAEGYVGRVLGFDLEAAVESDPPREGFEEGIPAELKHAVLMLASWWYETREAAGEDAREAPFGVREILDSYREWTF